MSPTQPTQEPTRAIAASFMANHRIVGGMRMAEDWGPLVRRFRVLHGLTQERIAEMFGVSQRTVSRWERSENKPSPQCRRRLRDLTPQEPSGHATLQEDHVAFAIAERAVALLGSLSPESIERLPAAERRRLAEHCRQVAQLAASRNGAPSKPDSLAEPQNRQDANAPRQADRRADGPDNGKIS
jgi:transcriptional regulator with XRE-family HTH domain